MAKTNYKLKPGTAKNAAGENEGMLISKIIAFLKMNGWVVWRQDNSGKLDSSQAATNISRYMSNTLINRTTQTRKKERLRDYNDEPINTNLIQRDMFTMIGRCYKKVEESRKGIPDIIGFNKTNARFIGIEIKIGADIMSPEQTEWANELKDANGVFFLAKSYDQFLDSYYRRFKNV